MDCIEGMKKLEDNSIDLILTDPPYGITKANWDKVPSKEYFDEMFRVSKNQIFFGGQFFDLPKKEGWIVWYKRPFLKTTNEAELIWVSFHIKTKVLDYTYAGNFEGFTGQKLHPNYKKEKVAFTSEKPINVVTWLLQQFSKEGEIVLDPYMGTGTTILACLRLNINYIGFDISKEYCELVRKKMKEVHGYIDVWMPK